MCYRYVVPILVDTYNVLHVTGVLPPEMAGLDVDGLAEMVARSRFGRADAWLVCDGQPPGQPRRRIAGGHIVIQYCGRGVEADDVIERMIEASTGPRRLMVVSSDHRIMRMSRRRRCRTESSASFLEKLVHDSARRHVAIPVTKPEVPLSREQIERWVRIFGLEDELMRLPASTFERGQNSHKETPPSYGDVAAPPPPRRRALEGVKRLEDIDPDELERFDMGEWLS